MQVINFHIVYTTNVIHEQCHLKKKILTYLNEQVGLNIRFINIEGQTFDSIILI